MKTSFARVLSLVVTVAVLGGAAIAAVALSPHAQQPVSVGCRSSAPGWVRFESAGRWASPWIHMRTVTQCYDSEGEPTGPVQYVTWNGHTREWTKDRPADTNYVITPHRPSPAPTGRTPHANPRTGRTT